MRGLTLRTPDALRLAAFDRRLERGVARPIAVALSGGSDSTALLWLAAAWARTAGRRLVALSVDHGLNPHSAAWTAAAGALAAQLDIAWRPLVWAGDKPAAGLPAAARRARHALLADAARSHGACVVLMGHTADDMAESELIRSDTPTHGHLAEWAPSPVWPQGRGVMLLRPLLHLRRVELRALLVEQGLTWLEDPANADLRFARPRARAALAAQRVPTSLAVWKAPTVGGRVDAWGCVHVSRDAPADLLAKAVVCASGGERPPRLAAITRLQTRLATGANVSATLGGAKVVAHGDEVKMARDPGERRRGGAAAEPELHPAADGGMVFDGRFTVSAAPAWRLTWLGGLAARLADTDARRLRAAPVLARGAAPALVGPDGGVRLAATFREGSGQATALAGQRLAAACGRIADEADAARDPAAWLSA